MSRQNVVIKHYPLQGPILRTQKPDTNQWRAKFCQPTKNTTRAQGQCSISTQSTGDRISWLHMNHSIRSHVRYVRTYDTIHNTGATGTSTCRQRSYPVPGSSNQKTTRRSYTDISDVPNFTKGTRPTVT